MPHQLYSLAGCTAALECDTGELGGVEDIFAGLWRAVRQPYGIISAFAEHQAVLVHHGIIAVDIGVGVAGFGNLSKGNRRFLLGIIIAWGTFWCIEAWCHLTIEFREVLPGNS